MLRLRSALPQAACIVLLSSLLALGVNALRPDGLPLLHAQQSAVQLPQEQEEIELKDAVLLFMAKRAVFLDARHPEEYAKGHIQGALNLPVGQFGLFFEDVRPKLEGKEALICYCDGERCPLGHELAQELRAAGFGNVFVLHNGLTRWHTEQLPVEQAAPQVIPLGQ